MGIFLPLIVDQRAIPEELDYKQEGENDGEYNISASIPPSLPTHLDSNVLIEIGIF